MKLQPYLSFDGTCFEAFTFYAQLLGGEIVGLLRFGERPELSSPGWEDRILHATLRVGDQELLGADAFPDGYRMPQGFDVTIAIDKLEEAKRIFNALAEVGKIRMSLQETFWSRGFGMVTDRFDIPWMINCGR